MRPPPIASHQPLTSARLTSPSAAVSSTIFRQYAAGVQSLRLHPRRPSSSSAGKSRCAIICSISKDETPPTSRRVALITPLLAAAAASFLPTARSSRAEEAPATSAGGPPAAAPFPSPATGPSPLGTSSEEKLASKDEEIVNWRIYDATAIGEPVVIGKDKMSSIWEKVMNARIVYLGEAEQVPTHYDKVLEVEIVKSLRKRCLDGERTFSIAMEAFPSDIQEQLNQFVDKRIDGEKLKSLTSHWPPQLWMEYEPLLTYCRDNGVRIVACGIPLKILRTVRAEGIRGLSKAERKTYAPPAGSGFVSGFTSISHRSLIDVKAASQSAPFGPSSYLSVQARVVEEYTMSQIILQAIANGGSNGMLVVVTGAGHVIYGPRGTGLPARISGKMQKKKQVVILLDPERQLIRREGEAPVADFLWYSAARPCSRNCFDRAEIARVMNAAGRTREALPQDLQKGLDLGLISPEVLQNFFDLEKYPLVAELTHSFQGFRERLLADPKFLHRLAIEEAISITTTLLAQYERRKENFLEELDYVITDTLRGSVVDFFTVWLPAPTVSFLSNADDLSVPVADNMDNLLGLLGFIPDNAFQKNISGKYWNLNHRIASVLVGGFKLASVGFISSIGAVGASNLLFALRRFINPAVVSIQVNRRSPILKSAAVYGCFLGTSANLRYQFIAGIVEHRLSEEFASETLLVNALSFVSRTVNSYWGTQQWVDLARFTGLQTRESMLPSYEKPESPSPATVQLNMADERGVDEMNNERVMLFQNKKNEWLR